MIPPTRTRILATLGPATADRESMRGLLDEGCDAFRLNFSHGTLEEHRALLDSGREAAAAAGCSVAWVGDLGGPEIRLGRVAADDGWELRPGDRFMLAREAGEGRVAINHPELIDEIRVGDRVLVEDGAVHLLAVEKPADGVVCNCVRGGRIRSHKGVNLPDTPVSLDPITEYDGSCIEWAVDQGLDYLAMSFVRRADDVTRLRSRLGTKGAGIGIIAKIERPEALKEIGGIIDAADAVMVARGDLGVEMDLADVPIIQKDIIRRCRSRQRPVIVATQMLQSMIDQASPTRAEVSDVANAIFDGADAVMLSGETSVGRFPTAAVRMMTVVAKSTEAYLFGGREEETDERPTLRTSSERDVALARGVRELVDHIDVKRVAVWSQSGAAARVLSKQRLAATVLGMSDDPTALRRMALCFGVVAEGMEVPGDLSELRSKLSERLVADGRAREGDLVLIVASTEIGTPRASNAIVIHRIGEQ